MPTDKEANARSQPTDGLLSLRKRSQVGRRQPEAAPQGGRSQASSLRGDRLPRLESSQATRSRHAQTDGLARRVALPRSGATREEATRMPALTPLPRPAAAARHAPAARLQGAASARCKLPPLPAAPATSAARGRETSTGTAASGHRRIVPSAQGVRGDQGTAARAQVQRPAPLSPTARAAAVKGTARCLRSEVPGKVAAASRRPSQQPEARRDGAHSTAVATTARTDEVGAADGGAAPTAQPALAEEEEWEEDSDKELSREDFTTDNIWVNPSVPELFQDPHAGPQEEEHHTTLTPTVQDEAKSPASPVFGEQDTASVAESQTPTPHSSTSSVAVLCDIADCIALAEEEEWEENSDKELSRGEDFTINTIWDEAKSPASPVFGEQDTAAAAAERQTPTPHSSTSSVAVLCDIADCIAEEEEWEENSDKELSQGEDFTINTIWVNPLVPELFQDPHAGPQEGPSSKGEGAAGEPQSASPAPAVLTDAEPADSALDGAAEEEGHHALLDPAVQDEAKKSPASPVFGEQDTAAAAAESQTPTPHSSTGSAVAPWDIANCIVKEVLMEALAAKQPPSQQPAEQPDRAQSVDAVMAPRTPAGPQDSESPLAREPQAEASTALLVPAACEDGEDTASPMAGEHQEEASSTVASQAVQQDEVASSSPPNPLADAGVPHLAPAVDEEGEAAGSPLAQDPQYQVSQAHVAGTGHPKAREAGTAPGLCAAGRWLAASEHRGDAQQSSGPSDVPEDDSGGRQELPRQPPSLSPTVLLSFPRRHRHPPARPSSTAMALPLQEGAEGSAQGVPLCLRGGTARAVVSRCQCQAGPQRRQLALSLHSVQREQHGEARKGWGRGRHPRHSAALRTGCCQPPLGCGHFLRPIKLTVFPQCSSVPGPSREKDGCRQGLCPQAELERPCAPSSVLQLPPGWGLRCPRSAVLVF
ncbi:LOW QUALITY PROTEIN: uncharacterized protein LOC128154035 [Harpia harpyja]|uniref:LOW QUALITY PROTEIN: uncharacterized protein LOC128154035 n=1 Tax=Harpia harpyja TaxID=202280 RepID=UPI0022B16E07|nr:LOW QUALITY PROTEIN: uncharacterized protein LOC128154035 [Harpia harpyja]